MDFKIEKGSKKDLNEIVKLNSQIFAGMYEDEPYNLRQYKARLKGKDEIIYVSRDEGRLVADSVSYVEGDYLYLWIMGVLTLYKSEGIGKELLRLNQVEARRRDLSGVNIKVLEVSSRMRHMVEKEGYKVVDFKKSESSSNQNIYFYRLDFKKNN